MNITRYSPFTYDIKVDPWSIIVCEIKIRDTKKPVKININAQIYFKNPNYINRIDVVTSDTHVLKTSDKHVLMIKIPGFRNSVRSFVHIALDPNEDVNTKIFIEDLLIEELSKYKKRRMTEKEIIKNRIEQLKKGNICIICEGLMLGDSGFAKAMRNVSFELDNYFNIKALPLDGDNINFLNTDKGKKLKLLIENTLDPHLWISMNNPMGVSKHDCYSIGYVMFETEIFPDKYVQHLKKIDEVWTPSKFCKDTMIRSGLENEKIFIMPLGTDTELFDPNKVQPVDMSGMENKYKFLCICGYSERKGIKTLVRAYAEEFSGHDDIALYIKGGWYPMDKARNEINNLIADIEKPPLIHLDFNIYPDNELARIYKTCDCFVLPTRGEGWGLPLCEAMSMGLPTIATNWGGHLDFMNNYNSYLIDIDGTGTCPECDWICTEYVGNKFAIPNKDHLKKLMRYVYEHREESKTKGKISREFILNNFSWKISCKKIHDRIRDVVKELIYKEELQLKILNESPIYIS